MEKLTIKVLVENSSSDKLLGEHGLSLLIEYNQGCFLLDSGQSDLVLINSKMMQVDLSKVEYAILSHGHYDHGNGFANLLALYPMNVYAMKGCFDDYYSDSKGSIHYIGLSRAVKAMKDYFTIINESMMIKEDIYLIKHTLCSKHSGLYRKDGSEYVDDSFNHEMSVVLKTSKGIVILNSCSHHGLDIILSDISRLFPNEKLYAYLGGLHIGKKHVEDKVDVIIKALNKYQVNKLYTGHCSGEEGYQMLKESLPNQIFPLTTGTIIEL